MRKPLASCGLRFDGGRARRGPAPPPAREREAGDDVPEAPHAGHDGHAAQAAEEAEDQHQPEPRIADAHLDGDGAPEFLDAWGRPISFFRWAPGFTSQIQGNANLLSFPPPTAPDPLRNWDQAAAADHDPFDLFRVDFKAFRLQPVIYSAGRDEELGIDPYLNEVVWRPAANVSNPCILPASVMCRGDITTLRSTSWSDWQQTPSG